MLIGPIQKGRDQGPGKGPPVESYYKNEQPGKAGLCARDAARRVTARVMAQWAMDLLELRRTGEIRPGWREGTPGPAAPHGLRAVGAGSWASREAERRLLAWRPTRRAA